jgi:hypothetical protein
MIVGVDIFSGEKLHASTERTEISVVVQNLVSMFHVWQHFCSKTAQLLPCSAAAVLLRPSVELLSVLRSADAEPTLQRLFLLCSVWVTILKTEAVDIFASCAISSHDLRRSSSDRVLTLTTDVSSVAVTGRPLLGASWMINQYSRIRDAHRDIVLQSITLSPQT